MAVNMTISMSPKIEETIRERAREIGLSKSEYLRSLVLRDMEAHAHD